MALTALLEGSPVIAPLLEDAEWQRCIDISRSHPDALIHRVTREQMYPRTSRLGLRHFAHRAGMHGTNPESMQHQMLKAVIAHHLQEQGCTVDIEAPAPDASWIADVLTTSPTGARHAWEIQLSRQAEDEFRQRTDRYRDAGIETVWITPHTDRLPEGIDAIHTPIRKSTRLSACVEALQETVTLVRGLCRVESSATLADALTGIISGAIRHSHPITTVSVYPDECWKCGAWSTAWMIAGVYLPGPPEPGYSFQEMTPAMFEKAEAERRDPAILNLVDALVREHNLPPRVIPRLRDSRTAGRTYLGQTCPTCGALWGDMYRVLGELDYSTHTVCLLPGRAASERTYWGWCSPNLPATARITDLTKHY